MNIDPTALLRLMWLASPALPVGAFSYSEGLESAVETGWVHDEASAGDWLVDQLWLSITRSELPAVVHAMNAWLRRDPPEVLAVNHWVLRTRESSEQRAQTVQMGKSLMDWLRNSEHRGDGRLVHPWLTTPTWPVAYALAATLAEVSTQQAALANAFGWAENMVQAAMKAVPLGQAAAQRILTRLSHDVPGAVEEALKVQPDERQAFTPMLALLGAAHEHQYTRIFRS